jgi:hypothetical protein
MLWLRLPGSRCGFEGEAKRRICRRLTGCGFSYTASGGLTNFC